MSTSTSTSTPLLDHSLESFRAFFASRDNWCTGRLIDPSGNHCAFGHVGSVAGMSIHPFLTEIGVALAAAFIPLVTEEHVARNASGYHGAAMMWGMSPMSAQPLSRELYYGHALVVDINNGGVERYQQETPKARILAALDDLIALRDAALDAVEDRALVDMEVSVSTPAFAPAPAAVESTSLHSSVHAHV